MIKNLLGGKKIIMDKLVDARGLSCPQPVILTKKAFDEGVNVVITLVDNEAARENVTRFGQSLNCQVDVAKEDNYYRITMARQEGNAAQSASCSACRNDVVFVGSQFFGRGDEELGQVLMKSFLYALSENPGSVKTMIFMNSGVKLTTEGSPVLDLIKTISDKGVEVFSCGTCLDFYGLKDSLKVGAVTNMYSALEMMQGANKVIAV